MSYVSDVSAPFVALTLIDWLTVLGCALIGGVARWADGRGYPHDMTAVRNGYLGVAAIPALLPVSKSFVGVTLGLHWWMGVVAILVLAALWAAIWTPRQKNREEFDDMALRWALPIALYGIGLGFLVWSPWPIPTLLIAGLLVTLLVWEGVTVGWTPVDSERLDGTAVSEFWAGFSAYGALALGLRIH